MSLLQRSLRSSTVIASLLVAACTVLAGCEPESGPASESDDATAAAQPTVDASTTGLDLKLDLYVHPDERASGEVWVLHGVTSQNLTSARAFDGSGDVGKTNLVSARVFEVVLDAASIEPLLEETRLFVKLGVSGASAPFYAAVMLAPRLRHFSGSSKIYALSEFRPVLVGSDVRFRGTTGISSGVTRLAVEGPLGPAEALTKKSSTEYAFDFSSTSIIASARATSPLVKLTAKSAGAAIEKDGTLSLDVTDLGLTQDNPATAFPDPPCDPAVEQCLSELPHSATDTGDCGTAKEVRICRASFG